VSASSDNPEAARRVARAIYEGCASLRDFPYLGRPSTRLTGRRELVFASLPYIVIYQVTQHAVEISRIFLVFVGSLLPAADSTLKVTPQTIAWGYYWSAAKPVLTIHSGDTVTIETVSGNPERLEQAGWPADQIPSALRTIYKEIPQDQRDRLRPYRLRRHQGRAAPRCAIVVRRLMELAALCECPASPN
jgi:hypothetical protein